jgi:hypothetical protein
MDHPVCDYLAELGIPFERKGFHYLLDLLPLMAGGARYGLACGYVAHLWGVTSDGVAKSTTEAIQAGFWRNKALWKSRGLADDYPQPGQFCARLVALLFPVR